MGDNSAAFDNGCFHACVRKYCGVGTRRCAVVRILSVGNGTVDVFFKLPHTNGEYLCCQQCNNGKGVFSPACNADFNGFSELISLAIQYVFLIIFLVYYAAAKQGVQPNLWMLMTPLIVLQLAMLSLGCGIIISALTTKYRDLAMLVGFGTQLWMYASPIAYDMFRFTAFAPGGKWHALYMCNPISPIVNLFRYAYLGTGAIEWKYYFIGWGITLALLFIGIVLFSRVEKTFMDTV